MKEEMAGGSASAPRVDELRIISAILEMHKWAQRWIRAAGRTVYNDQYLLIRV